MDFEKLREYIGKTEMTEDLAAARSVVGLAATLDYTEPPWPTGELPPLCHWLYFLPNAPQREMDQDGHPKRGGFLPPVTLPRRMWAGSRLTFETPVRIGETMKRCSTIASIDHKTGKSGTLVFVTVKHDLRTASGHVLTEEQDIVYREAVTSGKTAPTRKVTTEAPEADWIRVVTPDPVMLFRFSALTFNAHRIHYDRPYCQNVEGYPGLVVHGPFTAILLMDLFLRHHPGAQVKSFNFRGQKPLFDLRPFTLCGKGLPGGANLWVLDADGQVAMSAELAAD